MKSNSSVMEHVSNTRTAAKARSSRVPSQAAAQAEPLPLAAEQEQQHLYLSEKLHKKQQKLSSCEEALAAAQDLNKELAAELISQREMLAGTRDLDSVMNQHELHIIISVAQSLT
jgi:flagellar motility protein MotE (MotC chaperone)